MPLTHCLGYDTILLKAFQSIYKAFLDWNHLGQYEFDQLLNGIDALDRKSKKIGPPREKYGILKNTSCAFK